MKKSGIGIALLQLLINNHDNGDSLVRESAFKKYCIELYSGAPSINEITKCVELINSRVNRNVVIEGLIPVGGIISSSQEPSYFTEYSISGLSKIIEILKVDVEGGNSKEESSEFEELIKFQEEWSKMSFSDKKQITIETDCVNNIGAQYYNEDNFYEAIKSFKKAIEIMPTNDDALKNLIICYQYTGELNKIPRVSKMLRYLGY